MLLPRNIHSAVLWCAALLFPLVPITRSAHAAGQPLDNELATQAYAVIENWVGRAAVPKQSLAINASDVSAVSVTLRFSGLPIGHGIASLDNPLSPLASSTPTDIMALARSATQAALDDSQANLVEVSANHPGVMPTDLAALAPMLQLDLQIARVPQRLMLDNLADLPGRITIDAQGMALRDAKSNHWAWQFPGQAVAANIPLQGQLNRLLSGLNMNLTDMPLIGTDNGPALYRFDIVQLVRIQSDEQPTPLYRGQVVLPPAPLDLTAITQWSKQWADRLIARQNSQGEFAGTFHPSLSRYDPLIAPPADSALACYALSAYSKTVGPNDGLAAVNAARNGLEKLMADLGATPDKTQPNRIFQPSTQDSALTLLALLELPGNARYKEQRDRLATWLTASFTPNWGFRGSPNAQSNTATPPVRAAAALAMVRMYDQTRDEKYLLVAQSELALLWTDVAKRQVDVIMPWAALAEFDLARLGKPSPGLLMVLKTCQTIRDRQLTDNPENPQPPSPDTIGGFRTDGPVFTEPTWLTAGPLVALADALPVKNFVTPADRPTWMLSVALGLRYCAQLTMTESSAYYVRDLKRAIGGMRSSNFDNRQPTAATAYALLAASQFQQALTQLIDESK